MASSFVGLPVVCSLQDQITTVEGTVSSIDAVQGSITLESVTIRKNGQFHNQVPIRVLSRAEVAGLALLSTQKAPSRSSESSQRSHHSTPRNVLPSPSPIPPPSPLAHSSRPPSHAGSPSTIYPPTSATASELEDEVSKPSRARARKSRRGKGSKEDAMTGNEADESATPFDDEEPERRRGAVGTSGAMRRVDYAEAPAANQPFAEEFDFGAGLASFDKKAIFQQIRSQDETDPSLRLHAHNRNRALAKLAPTESVLSPAELYEQNQQQQQQSTSPLPPADVSTDETSDDDDQPVPPPRVVERERRSTIKPPVGGKNGQGAVGKDFVTPLGVSAVAVRLKQYKEALSICDIETGPTAIQRTENAGRGIATFVLQTLWRDRRLFPLEPRKRPSICILCDDCEKGAVALRAGVHLSNHGSRVVAYILTTDDHSEVFRTNLRVFSSAGGRILRELEDLAPEYDLLIDAIADNETQSFLEAKSSADLAAATWASESGLPILSIDAALGTDHDTGAPTTSSPLRPNFVLCRGAVRAGCRVGSAEIVLVDVGIAPSLWSRVGVDEWDSSTFGAEFVVPLSRV